jgi:lysozyme
MTFTLLVSHLQSIAFTGLLLLSGLTNSNTPSGNSNNPTNEKSTKYTSATLKGIDVSRWQKEVDWIQVRDADVTFAFVKATQGNYRLDPYFERNWEGTKQNGIVRGAYHFYKPEIPVQEQINLFINTVRLEPGDLPPVLDVEIIDKHVSPQQLRADIKTWMEAITSHYGVKPIIYTYQNYYRRYLKGHFPEYHFWIARYSDVQPEVEKSDSWMFWQFTDRGAIAGINAHVDINHFPGNWEQLSTLLIPEYAAKEMPVGLLQQLKYKQPLP